MTLCTILLTGPLSAGGVTLITHGFNGNVLDWINPMAQRIPEYPELAGTTVSHYKIEITAGGGGMLDASASWISGPMPDQTDSGEILISLDWSSLAKLFFGASSTEVGEAAAAALLDAGLIPEMNGRPLAELPLHLIGHSRGASVVTEMARELGEQGVWVDHVTTLDPVPVSWFGDADVTTWEKVLYADNFYQKIDGTNGDPVLGAYDRHLEDLGGGYDSAHSDVHLWYHGTIELTTPATDTQFDITESERGTWWTSTEAAGAEAGFRYSLIGGGDRLSTTEPAGAGTGPINDGVNGLWDFGAGSANNRTALESWNDQWPNVIVCRRTLSGSVPTGGSFDLELHYQSDESIVGETTVTVLLDPDRNPWNGNEFALDQQPLIGSGPGNVLMTTLAIPVPAGNEGVSAICTRIEQGGRTRYLYVPEPLEVTSAVPPPSIVAGSFRVEDGLVTFTILGSPGQTVIVEASANLIDWQTIATDTLKGTSWIFSDPDSPTFARRFYRVSAE